MAEMVLDLDTFSGEPKKIKLGGKEFDLSFIPFEVSLRIYSLIPEMEKMQEGRSITVEDYDKILAVILEVLRISDESVDEKWLRRQINLKRFNPLLTFIFSAVFDEGKKNDEAEEVLTSSSTSGE